MENDIQKSIEIYKEQLNGGYIQTAYFTLIKYVAELKSNFPKQYQTGNISPGYLDYTYFPFFDLSLRERKLRFGVVLNHKMLRFELWLMGQNGDIQKKYWDVFKDTPWNQGRNEMPRYSVLEDQLDFACKEKMTGNIIDRAVAVAAEIQQYLEKAGCYTKCQ